MADNKDPQRGPGNKSSGGNADGGGTSGNKSPGGGAAAEKSDGNTRGGTPQQHAEAGRQSHKND